jgi:dTDP-glucose 4,6-dehydratase
VGPIVLKKLTQRGHKVTVFNRGQHKTEYGDGVEFVRGDRHQGFKLKQHFDVVIDMVASKGEDTKRALADLSFDFFVHMSSVAVYEKSELFPLTEDAPSGDWPIFGGYNAGKVACERMLEASGIKYAAIRPTYVLGPANYADRENFIYSHVREGKTLVLPGDGQALMQFVFAVDVAEAFAAVSEAKAFGAFNLVGDEQITGKGLVEAMATLVGKPAKIVYNPATNGEDFDEDEFPFANENLVCTNDRIKQLGVKLTPLLAGLKSDYDSYYSTNS